MNFVIKLESNKQKNQALTSESLIMKKLTALNFINSAKYYSHGMV